MIDVHEVQAAHDVHVDDDDDVHDVQAAHDVQHVQCAAWCASSKLKISAPLQINAPSLASQQI